MVSGGRQEARCGPRWLVGSESCCRGPANCKASRNSEQREPAVDRPASQKMHREPTLQSGSTRAGSQVLPNNTQELHVSPSTPEPLGKIIVRERARRLLEQLFLKGHLLWAAHYSFLKDSLQNCTEMFLHALSFAHKTRLFLATCTARQPRALI